MNSQQSLPEDNIRKNTFKLIYEAMVLPNFKLKQRHYQKNLKTTKTIDQSLMNIDVKIRSNINKLNHSWMWL